jgi:hypothetical protein
MRNEYSALSLQMVRVFVAIPPYAIAFRRTKSDASRVLSAANHERANRHSRQYSGW